MERLCRETRCFPPPAACWGGRDLGVRAPPLPGGRTRLLERVRIALLRDRVGPRLLGRLAVFGIFLAQRKQLLGITARAERAWHAHVEGPVESHVA